MDIQIERFSEEHVEAVSALILRDLFEVNINDYPLEEMEEFAKEFTPEGLWALARKRIIYVALCDGVPVATGGIGRDLARGWMLYALFVRPDVHGMGVGRRLLERLEDCAREIGVSRLSLQASLSSNLFYEKQGYRYVGGVRMRDPAGHYKMEKHLHEPRRPSAMAQLALDSACDKRISLVGAGGKTTLLYLLARHFAREGLAVAVTTTTHILRPLEYPVCESGVPPLARGTVLVCGSPAVPETRTAPDKLTAPDAEMMSELLRRADMLLIEADGARGLPIKLPNENEPVILPESDRVIALAGLSALGRPLGEVCHRAKLAAETLGVPLDTVVTAELMAALLLRGYGDLDRLTILLNQADTPALEDQGQKLAALLRAEGIGRVCVTSLKREAGTI